MRVVAIFVALLALALPRTALAHAALRHAVPAAGAELAKPPDELQLDFSEAVVTARAEVSLRPEGGEAVVLVAPESEPASGTRLRRLIGAPLTPGNYEVRWRVISVDGHWTRGAYTFCVD